MVAAVVDISGVVDNNLVEINDLTMLYSIPHTESFFFFFFFEATGFTVDFCFAKSDLSPYGRFNSKSLCVMR